MSRVMVDTDVVSFLFKNDSRASLYRTHLLGKELVISFMTLAELLRWALERNWDKTRQTRLKEHLRQFAVHPFDAGPCRTWAEVSHAARKSSRPIETADAWSAATAVHHVIPLVTHNRRHYAGVPGLLLVCEPPA